MHIREWLRTDTFVKEVHQSTTDHEKLISFLVAAVSPAFFIIIATQKSGFF